MQLQRLENTGYLRTSPLSRTCLPMHSKCKLLTLGGLTTTGSRRQSASLEIETLEGFAFSSQNWRSPARPFEAGFTAVYPMPSPANLLPAIVLTCLLRSIDTISERLCSESERRLRENSFIWT